MATVNGSRRLMLISNSFCHGRGYLDHCAPAIRDFLGPVSTLTFVPYAAHESGWDAYTALARQRFLQLGVTVVGIQDLTHPTDGLCDAVFVGGGNTFRLLRRLYERDLLIDIVQAVDRGVRYLGASAGANIASPTIKTTNDMPIVAPPRLEALGLVPFQINPHYLDPQG